MTKPRWTGEENPYNYSPELFTHCLKLVDYAEGEVLAGRWLKGASWDQDNNQCLAQMLRTRPTLAGITIDALSKQILFAMDYPDSVTVPKFNDSIDTTAEDALLFLKHLRGSLERMAVQHGCARS